MHSSNRKLLAYLLVLFFLFTNVTYECLRFLFLFFFFFLGGGGKGINRSKVSVIFVKYVKVCVVFRTRGEKIQKIE